jgi:cytochrome c oxidase accessory protein FixG
MSIDLSHRIIQDSPTPNATGPNLSALRWHPWRRMLQVLCGVLLVVLPLTDGLRLDVRRQVFYFLWHRTGVADTYLLMWVALLGVWGLVAVSVLHGRLWCGWVCPQTLASDFADSLKRRIDKLLRARPGRPNFVVARGLWTAAMCAMALATAVILVCYWLAPAEVWSATWRPASDASAAMAVYGLAALIAADMLWVRRSFCRDVCPYGALMGLLGDDKTLAVRFLDEREPDCIRCGRCVAVCPTGIDIKHGVSQLACIGCGECVDACNDILGPRGKPGLIEFRYGTDAEYDRSKMRSAQRWGLWDGKRKAIAGGLIGILAVIVWLIYGPGPVSATVRANGDITQDATRVDNTFTVAVENGSPKPERFTVSVTGLADGVIEEPAAPVSVAARDIARFPVTVACPPATVGAGARRPIRLCLAGRDGKTIVLHTIFYRPVR